MIAVTSSCVVIPPPELLSSGSIGRIDKYGCKHEMQNTISRPNQHIIYTVSAPLNAVILEDLLLVARGEFFSWHVPYVHVGRGCSGAIGGAFHR